MKKNAFTMAEAVLVMAILGIIATIMITTLKPADFRDKGYAVMAKKVLTNIDNATTQILMNNSSDGTLGYLYEADTTTKLDTSAADTDGANAAKLATLYKKYLTTTRKECTNSTDCGECGNTYKGGFYLKDGACVAFKLGADSTGAATRFPGEDENVTAKATHGYLFFDINGTEGPNTIGNDQYLIPLGAEGIDYEAKESST